MLHKILAASREFPLKGYLKNSENYAPPRMHNYATGRVDLKSADLFPLGKKIIVHFLSRETALLH